MDRRQDAVNREGFAVRRALVVAFVVLVFLVAGVVSLFAFVLPRGAGSLVPGAASGIPFPSGTPPPTTHATGVAFTVAATNVSGTGQSRTITAVLNNVGTATAHNTWAKVEVIVQGSRIPVSGNDYLTIQVGNVEAGASVIRDVTIEFSLLDSVRVLQNGAHIVLTLTCDETAQEFTYDYVSG